MSSSEEEEDIGQQIRVAFVLDASVKNRDLEVPTEAIAVPADVRRKGLSAVINHLLGRRIDGKDDDDDEDDKIEDALPFDFLINGKLLRSGVESAARRYGLSLEQAIQLTYFPAQEAPQESGKGEPIPDWIGCLEYRGNHVVTGGYDGSIRLHSVGGDILETEATAKAHGAPIKCMSVAENDTGLMIASGSLDQSLVVHTYDPDTNSFKPFATFTEGHTNAIGCVDLSSQRMVSGDWDGGISIWDIHVSAVVEEEGQTVKKQKSSKGISNCSATKTVKPLVTFVGHGSQISGVAWVPNTDNNFVTGSWDHSVKVWDAEKQDCLLTLNGSRVVACLDLSQHSQVLATGHPDCTVRLWDIRTKDAESTSLVSDSSLKPSHKAWVSAVQWSKKDPYILASASHDGSLKIWDIRSTVPLHTVRTHPNEEKSLCLAFGQNGVIYTGGTDCIVKQYKC